MKGPTEPGSGMWRNMLLIWSSSSESSWLPSPIVVSTQRLVSPRAPRSFFKFIFTSGR